jgi:hypothetical protein
MRKPLILIALIIAVVMIPALAQATAILYDIQDLGGGVWKYDYTVRNDSLPSPITEFTIWFDYGLYDVLFVESAKPDWFEQSADPTVVLGSGQDGFYNAISLAAGIAPGAEEAGFSVSFVWLYEFAPPTFQRFDIVENGQVVDQGLTQPITPQVPEPGILALFGIGLIGAALSKAIGRHRS